jgi:hypothetical protein
MRKLLVELICSERRKQTTRNSTFRPRLELLFDKGLEYRTWGSMWMVEEKLSKI